MREKPFGPDRRWIRITCLPPCANTAAPLDRRRQRLAFEYTMSRYVLKLRLQLAEKLLPVLVTFLLALAAAGPARAASGGIAKSIHDFSEASWVRSAKAAKQS